MAQMLCLCMAVRMRRAAHRCHGHSSLFISSGLEVLICAMTRVAT